jgi:hypothetical protein
MIAVLKKIRSLFTPAEQRKVVWMLVLCILMAMAEMSGVVSIMPFLSVLANPGVIQEQALLQTVYHYFAFTDTRAFIVALGMVSIAIVIFSSAFKTITLHVLNRFMQMERTSISSRLLARYRGHDNGAWQHETPAGRLIWKSASLGYFRLFGLPVYLFELLQELRQFQPDLLFGASDIPHLAITRWLANRLRICYAVDIYDNFESFGQARIPGMVAALRKAARDAKLVVTASDQIEEQVIPFPNHS